MCVHETGPGRDGIRNGRASYPRMGEDAFEREREMIKKVRKEMSREMEDRFRCKKKCSNTTSVFDERERTESEGGEDS